MIHETSVQSLVEGLALIKYNLSFNQIVIGQKTRPIISALFAFPGLVLDNRQFVNNNNIPITCTSLNLLRHRIYNK